jgi:hypothetical protein
MAQFKRVPVDEARPVTKAKVPSQRDQIRREYEEALQDAVIGHGEALAILIGPDDKPLTIKNRIDRAAQSLGLDHIKVRRKGDYVYAYVDSDGSNESGKDQGSI